MSHIGVGGFHRAHQALYLQELIEWGGHNDWGICGVGLLPGDRKMSDVLRGQDYLYTLLERDARNKRAVIVASITSYLLAEEDAPAIIAQLAAPETRIVSLTITEGGYYVHAGTGAFDSTHPAIQHDLANSQNPTTVYGYLLLALRLRRERGLPPFTVLSCDNIQGNGAVARTMLLSFAELVAPELARWIAENVAFPNTMVDRITPVTTDIDRAAIAERYGIEDGWPVVCETFRQWVIEDWFCSGRPAFENVGVQMTGDVGPYETMKIRLLNASHSAMGYLGYLAGFRTIGEIIADPDFAQYIRALMDEEVTPLLPPVAGVNLTEYKATLVERFANPNIRDTALRICGGGSGKMPKFILSSLQEARERGRGFRRLALCVAAWFRFLQGTDEAGQPIPLDDPQADRLRGAALAGGKNPLPLLSLTDMFGDLGRDSLVVETIGRALASLYERGARATLQDYL